MIYSPRRPLIFCFSLCFVAATYTHLVSACHKDFAVLSLHRLNSALGTHGSHWCAYSWLVNNNVWDHNPPPMRVRGWPKPLRCLFVE